MKTKKLIVYGVILAITLSCSNEKILLEDVNSNSSGIDFINKIQDSPQLSILDYLYFYNKNSIIVVLFGIGSLDT